MEYDRYKGHHKLYILGIVCMILCLGFLFFSLYITPYLIWGEHYDVPEFVSTLLALFEDRFQYSSATSSFLVWLLFFTPSLICGFISYRISNDIDNSLLGGQDPIPAVDKSEILQEVRRDRAESTRLSLKILVLMILVVLAILLLQLIIY